MNVLLLRMTEAPAELCGLAAATCTKSSDYEKSFNHAMSAGHTSILEHAVFTFKIEGIRDFDKDQDGDPIIEVVVKNEQPTGTLIVDKSVTLRDDIDTSLVDISDLSGIEFKLTAKENIIDYADGSIIYEKGTEMGRNSYCSFARDRDRCIRVILV